MATKSKESDYLDNLEPGRRLALILLSNIRDLEVVSAIINSDSLNFDQEIACFMDTLKCVNCDNEINNEGSVIYCSEYCQQIAGTIRYVRRARIGHRESEIEFQVGLGDRLNHLPNGGYPVRDRHLSKELRERIFKRDNYTCRICGKKEAQQIDHIMGSSDDPTNLQAACADCNREKAFSNTRLATAEEKKFIENLYFNMAMRIATPVPSLACDDHERWQKTEPKIRGARKKIIKNRIVK
ncbi:HNH endonuclease [Nitrosomonas ureae]|uniref:5-methylcytosine-specific restriction endonuclease McrA n=1 Tax=Nitrosomonas ureae TaxID=44577 RepID=A0A286ALM9_9PROT|nr:HNH endonuclease signature motif containing protein [Nitrosomonas ureae]SOD22794.1 5-methylcytosine-specific restriction endonuclease McrA [Nitrosomonas ureae]